jgi:hypothetical protein
LSLTKTHHVFASASETGINTFLKAIFSTRPHFLNYGSSLFVPVSTVAATNMATIQFPGVPGGVQWAISFAIPTVDLFPDSSGGASPLPPVAHTFNIHTTVVLRIGCMSGTGKDGREGGKSTPLTTKLDAWALAEIIPHYFGPGTGFIGFQVDKVLLPEIKPGSLEAVLECLIRMLLSGALQNVQLPFHAISLGALTLALEEGPTIEDNQIKVWGSI